MYSPKTPGTILLLISSIFYIILSLLIIFGGTFSLLINQFPSQFEIFQDIQTFANNLAAFYVVYGAFIFFAGLTGFKNRNNLQKSNFLFILGIIIITIDIVGIFLLPTTSNASSLILWVLPFAYIAGAYQNKRTKENAHVHL